MEQALVKCPGCGLILPDLHADADIRYHASGACFRKFSELSYHTIGKQDIQFIHQHALDAYAAQHAGAKMKPITAAFSLIGLYYALERGYNGRQVQRVHTLLARRNHSWVPLEPPGTPYSVTVGHVLDAPPEERDSMIRTWMQDVWNHWSHRHDWVRETCTALLGE